MKDSSGHRGNCWPWSSVSSSQGECGGRGESSGQVWGPTGKRRHRGSGSSKGTVRKQEENLDCDILEARRRKRFTRTLGCSGGCSQPAGKGTEAQRPWATLFPGSFWRLRLQNVLQSARGRSSVTTHHARPLSLWKEPFVTSFKKETPPSGEEHYLLPVRTDSYLRSSSTPAPCPWGTMKQRAGRDPLGGRWAV